MPVRDEFAPDLARGPLALAPPGLDQVHDLVWGWVGDLCGAEDRSRSPISQSSSNRRFHLVKHALEMPASAATSDRPVLAAFDQAPSSSRGQRGISVGHEG